MGKSLKKRIKDTEAELKLAKVKYHGIINKIFHIYDLETELDDLRELRGVDRE